MPNIRNFILSHVLEPFEEYSTAIQDTIIELIIQRLEKLYEYTLRFPTIVSPDQSRMDILRIIASQFMYNIREEADLREQVAILDNILYIYSKRGAIDTIENMWKYYGGSLPKDVEVVIPSYKLFRYSVSALSGTHTFAKGRDTLVLLDTVAPEDIPSGSPAHLIGTTRTILTKGITKGSDSISLYNVSGLVVGDRLNINDIYEGTIKEISEFTDRVDSSVNRPGVYEIRLTNNTYPIAELRKFLISELVAAGNYIYFVNTLHMNITEDDVGSNKYNYLAHTEDLLQINMSVLKSSQGFTWSGHNGLSVKSEDSSWSGRGSIFLELTRILDTSLVDLAYMPHEALGFYVSIIPLISEVRYPVNIKTDHLHILEYLLYCTPTESAMSIVRNLYNSQGDLIEFSYPGYFVLEESLLGEEVI